MKNKTPLFVILGLVLLGVAAFYFMQQKGSVSPLTGSPADIFSNALTGSGSVKCEYKDQEGQTVTAYVKGGKIRTEMMGGTQGNMNFIMRDQMMYSWNQGTKEGFVYKVPEVTGTPDETETPDQSGAKDVKADLEQYKESCTNTSVADSVFEVPADVNLVDYSKMMQDSMKQIPDNYKQYMPQK